MNNTLEIPWKPLLLKPFQNPTFITAKREICLNPSKPSSPLQRCRFMRLQLPSSVQPPSRRKLSASQANPVVSEEDPTPPLKQKLRVAVKPMEKPRVVLKFIWMKRVIGIALDQVIPRRGTFPLSPYLFWPKEDALEQLKVLLESKPWISSRQSRILLNQAADIITLWQDNGGNY